ncbi:MAG: hypothetical protein AB2L09_06760 [Coriobacteriia bacterium]
MSGIEKVFPSLAETGYRVTSRRTSSYNCVAWAAEDHSQWWEPDAYGIYYWPDSASREWTLSALIEAYTSIGYTICDIPDLEPGVQKIAPYVLPTGVPTHVARQLGTGMWTSKCGQLEDIEHNLYAFAGTAYGDPIVFMARQR